jgi:hypothetical protein
LIRLLRFDRAIPSRRPIIATIVIIPLPPPAPGSVLFFVA